MITRIIDNFTGRLTKDNIGALDSGLAKYNTTYGNDPFSNIGNLSWFEIPVQITGAITDLIMAAKPRLESGITYVYAIGHTGRLYKIQVNNPTTKNPNYDNPVLLTTLTVNSPTFKYGSSIQFFGSTEKLFIGHDLGVTKVNFDGTGETFIGTLSSYTANVPRPSANFLGKLEYGNGANLVEIDSTETVISYAKLSPGFQTNSYVRDLDVSPDGNYLQVVVSKINSPDLTSTTQDTTSLASTDSYKFLWNGTDIGYTSYESFGGYSLTSNISFGSNSYTMGYDLGGAALYSGSQKIESLPTSISPNFGAMFNTGNLVGFASPDYDKVNAILTSSVLIYGQYDQETPRGLFRFFRYNNSVEVNVETIQVPVCLVVSNLFYGNSQSGYTNNIVGAAKIYFSVLGQDGSTAFYSFNIVPTGSGSAIGGVYETQQETSVRLFRSILHRKLKVYEIRVFTPPLVNNNSFQIDVIGNDGNPIANSSQTFTVGTNVTSGATLCKYNPKIDGGYSIGLRITNLGSVNWTCEKIEMDIDEINA